MLTLSLCMIVKNEEMHLERCLSSVKDVVDKIVIVDTGSVDKTLAIAEKYNANIFHFEWINDFSAARNFALKKCTTDWILYLDADEEVNSNSIDELKSYKLKTPAAVYCTVKSIGTSDLNGSVMRYPRLFANFPGVEFTGKVHEQIIDSVRKNKIPLVDSQIEIIHHGYAIDEAGLKQKKERNLSLLMLNENKNSNIYDTLKLINTLISLDKYDEAEQRINKLLENKSLSTNNFSLALFYKAQIKFEQNDLKSALDCALKSFKHFKNKPEVGYLIYLIFLRAENFNEALKYILFTINANKNLLDNKSNFESENILDQTDLYLRAINLHLMLNQKEAVEKLIINFAGFISTEHGVKNETVQTFLNNFIDNYSFEKVESEFLKKIFHLKHLAALLEIIKNCSDEKTIINNIELLIKIFSNSSVLYKNLANLYVNSNPEKAIELFNKSLELDKDPSVFINLISIYISKSDYKKVKECFSALQIHCSGKLQIKQKIELLKEKLQPILKNLD